MAQQLAHGVWFIADFATSDEALAWIAKGSAAGFELTREHRSPTVGNDQAFLMDRSLSNEIAGRLTRALSEHLPEGESGFAMDEMLEVYRYREGQEISVHTDASTPITAEVHSTHTLVIYLSRPGVGGQTVFPDLNLSIVPMPRGALLFHQSHAHFGDRVGQGEKYILRTAVAAPKGWV